MASHIVDCEDPDRDLKVAFIEHVQKKEIRW